MRQGPSSNNCSVLRQEAFPPLRQHGTVLRFTKQVQSRGEELGTGGGERGLGGLEEVSGADFGLQCGPGHCGNRVNVPGHLDPCHKGRSLLSEQTTLFI